MGLLVRKDLFVGTEYWPLFLLLIELLYVVHCCSLVSIASFVVTTERNCSQALPSLHSHPSSLVLNILDSLGGK